MEDRDKICKQFLIEPSINPISNRKIEINGPTFNKLVKLCKELDYEEEVNELLNMLILEERVGLTKVKDIDKSIISFMDLPEIIKLLQSDSRFRMHIYELIPFIIHKKELPDFLEQLFILNEHTLFDKILRELIKGDKKLLIDIMNALLDNKDILDKLIYILIEDPDNIKKFKGDDLTDLIEFSVADSRLYIYVQTIPLTYKQKLIIKNIFDHVILKDSYINFMKGLISVNAFLSFEKICDFLIDNENIIMKFNDDDFFNLIDLSFYYKSLYIKICDIIPKMMRPFNALDYESNSGLSIIVVKLMDYDDHDYMVKNTIKKMAENNLDDFYDYIEQFIFFTDEYNANTFKRMKAYFSLIPETMDKDSLYRSIGQSIFNSIDVLKENSEDLFNYVKDLIDVSVVLIDINLFNLTIEVLENEYQEYISDEMQFLIDEGKTFFES